MGVRIRQKDGKWYVFINHHGRRKAKCIGGSKKVAEEVKRTIEAKLILGDVGLLEEQPPPVPTLGDYAAKWLLQYAAPQCKESTYARYEGVVRNHVLPTFATTPLTAITRTAIKTLLVTKRTTLAPSSVQKILIPLREMLNHAVEEGLLPSNPAARVGRFVSKRHDPEHEIDPLTREELTRFLATVQGDAAHYYPLFLCLARTGLRLGEALALQWGDLDWHGRFLTVRRSVVRGRITTPKNGKTRQVDMSRQLTTVLHDLMTQRQAEAILQGRGETAPWVFCAPHGGLLDKDNLRRRVFHRCVQHAGLRRIRIHDLRHTYASLLIQQGESLVYIKDQLGHHSIQVTVDIYGHLVPGGNQAAVDRLDEGSLAAPICNLSATATSSTAQGQG